MTKHWCFGLRCEVSYNTDGTSQKKKKEIAPYPGGKIYMEYLGTSLDVCSFFLGKKERIRMCPPMCMSPCLVGEYVIVVIVDMAVIVQCELQVKF